MSREASPRTRWARSGLENLDRLCLTLDVLARRALARAVEAIYHVTSDLTTCSKRNDVSVNLGRKPIETPPRLRC